MSCSAMLTASLNRMLIMSQSNHSAASYADPMGKTLCFASRELSFPWIGNVAAGTTSTSSAKSKLVAYRHQRPDVDWSAFQSQKSWLGECVSTLMCNQIQKYLTLKIIRERTCSADKASKARIDCHLCMIHICAMEMHIMRS